MGAEKLGAAAAYGGSGTAVIFGLTPSEWSAIGVIGGLLIGFAGFLVNAYFAWRRDQREAAKR
jgi:hypothetical protein